MDLREQFQVIVDDLLRETDSSRITLRLNLPKLGADTTMPIVEARQPGIGSLLGRVRDNQQVSGTVRYMQRNRKLLIQSDTKNTEPGEEPPAALISDYGTLAQMLGGIWQDGTLIGWLSVHENRATRAWTAAEAASLSAAVDRVTKAVEAEAAS